MNLASKFSDTHTVRQTHTMAESKRLVLAFESRVSTEIKWALNTLIIFSCNTHNSLTLENQPYLLESLSNYLVFCVENIKSINFEDPIAAKNRLTTAIVPSYIDAKYYQGDGQDEQQYQGKLDYRTHGLFSHEMRKRE